MDSLSVIWLDHIPGLHSPVFKSSRINCVQYLEPTVDKIQGLLLMWGDAPGNAGMNGIQWGPLKELADE